MTVAQRRNQTWTNANVLLTAWKESPTPMHCIIFSHDSKIQWKCQKRNSEIFISHTINTHTHKHTHYTSRCASHAVSRTESKSKLPREAERTKKQNGSDVHSVATLLGSPTQLILKANISSANRMTAIQYIESPSHVPQYDTFFSLKSSFLLARRSAETSVSPQRSHFCFVLFWFCFSNNKIFLMKWTVSVYIQ